MNSEDVESMSDAEVGQYILLLCKSFVSGKAASLPDDLLYLAKVARCTKVSDLVLKKFPMVETTWGRRRRNEAMYGEWLSAADRSASASERGKKGNEIRWSGYESPKDLVEDQWSKLVIFCRNECVRCGAPAEQLVGGKLTRDHIVPRHMGGGDDIANLQPMCRSCNSSKGKETTDHRPKNWKDCLLISVAKGPDLGRPYHTNHTIPIISNQNVYLESGGQGSFKTVRSHWYRYFKKDLSTSKRNKEQYAAACSQYGEDRVLEYLEKWASANQWVAAHAKGENRLYVFLADLAVMIDGDTMRVTDETAKVTSDAVGQDAIAHALAADTEASARENEEFLLEKQKADEFAEATRGQI